MRKVERLQTGDKRTREGFLLFPKTIRYGYVTETRWLERAKWEDVCRIMRGDIYWVAYRWLDD